MRILLFVQIFDIISPYLFLLHYHYTESKEIIRKNIFGYKNEDELQEDTFVVVSVMTLLIGYFLYVSYTLFKRVEEKAEIQLKNPQNENNKMNQMNLIIFYFSL